MGLDWHESATSSPAAGMVSVQADCPLKQALKLIHQHARSTEKTVEAVAASVVARRVRIEAHP